MVVVVVVVVAAVVAGCLEFVVVAVVVDDDNADVRVVVAVFPFPCSAVRIGCCFSPVLLSLLSLLLLLLLLLILEGIEMVAGPTVGVLPLEIRLVVTTWGGDCDPSSLKGDGVRLRDCLVGLSSMGLWLSCNL